MGNDKEFIEYEDGTRVELTEDDVPELDKEFFKNAKYGLDGLAELVGEEAVAPLRKRGRPKSDNPKPTLTLRLDAELVAHLKNEVPGYNTKVGKLLNEAWQDGRL